MSDPTTRPGQDLPLPFIYIIILASGGEGVVFSTSSLLQLGVHTHFLHPFHEAGADE